MNKYLVIFSLTAVLAACGEKKRTGPSSGRSP
ncbi:MAG: lipoprotein [Methylobacter sp.]